MKIHKGYTEELKLVLPEVKAFKEDILVHDQNMLKGYAGRFIVGYRSSGTNLYRLDLVLDACRWERRNQGNSIECSHEFDVSFLSTNKSFLLFNEDGTSKKISKTEAIGLLEKRRQDARDIYKFFVDINLNLIAESLYFTVNQSKRWKSIIRSQWDNDSSSYLRKVRNHFHELEKLNILHDDSEDTIYGKLSVYYVVNRDITIGSDEELENAS